MTVGCPECGAMNKKGNKFCYECGFRLPPPTKAKKPIPASEAKRLRLKKRWLRGEITGEEYRAKLLKIRLKERFHTEDDGHLDVEDED